MLYCDLSLGSTCLWTGKPCLNNVDMAYRNYKGFPGELLFLDTQGTSDPTYDGLGTRFILAWASNGTDAVKIPLLSIPSQQFDIIINQKTYTLSIYENSPS